MSKEYDMINPKHYDEISVVFSCDDLASHFSFRIGNIIKYIWRLGDKPNNPIEQEIDKIIWYARSASRDGEVVDTSLVARFIYSKIVTAPNLTPEMKGKLRWIGIVLDGDYRLCDSTAFRKYFTE